VGNIFLGDDGFGPEVARRLASVPLPADVRVADYGIRGMHLAYDLEGYDALVLVDLVAPKGQPGRLSVTEVGAEDLRAGEFDAHGMDPAAMLGSLDRIGGALPRTIVVGCEPGTVDDGIGLSPPVAAAVKDAVEQVRAVVTELCADPEPGRVR